MLGSLRGIENHNENGLKWLTGDIYWNYSTETNDTEGVIQRMKEGSIPKNLILFPDIHATDPAEPFRATGQFTEDHFSFGMAHELGDTPMPKPDKRINMYRVRNIAQLKIAAMIITNALQYNFFDFVHFTEMLDYENMFFYVAEYDGMPVSACAAQHKDNVVYISWAGTFPEYRNRGICGSLIQMAEREGLQRGKTIAAVHGGSNAFRRIGYRVYYNVVNMSLIEDIDK
jgi:ribosomal protein S18 acetylase RimI-like enzyme